MLYFKCNKKGGNEKASPLTEVGGCAKPRDKNSPQKVFISLLQGQGREKLAGLPKAAKEKVTRIFIWRLNNDFEKEFKR